MAQRCRGWELYSSCNFTAPSKVYTYNTANDVTSDFTFEDIGTKNIWGSSKGSLDKWVDTITLPNYSPEITVIKPGTYPENTLIYNNTGYIGSGGNNGTRFAIKIERTSDEVLRIYTSTTAINYNDSGWSLDVTFSPSSFKDNTIPTNLILGVQAAGGGGGSYDASDSGAGGGSGAYVAMVFNIKNYPHIVVILGGSGSGGSNASGRHEYGNDANDSFILVEGIYTTGAKEVRIGGGKGGAGGVSDGTHSNGVGGSGGTITYEHVDTTSADTYLLYYSNGLKGGDTDVGSGSSSSKSGTSSSSTNAYFSKTYTSNMIYLGGYSGGSAGSGSGETDHGAGGAASLKGKGGNGASYYNSSSYSTATTGSTGAGGGGGDYHHADDDDPWGFGASGGYAHLSIYY